MTRAEISTLILSWVDDTKQGYFLAPQLNTFINLAVRQVQFELLGAGQNFYVKPVETQTVVGQSDYLLPSDFISEQRLEYVQSGSTYNENRIPIAQITTNQQDNMPISLGNPETYYLKKDRFTLQPTPSQVWTLRLYYSPRVVDLVNDTDVPDVPEQFMEYVAIVAALACYVKDDRVPDNLAAKSAQFQELLKKIASQRKQDRPRTVNQVQNYDDWGGLY